MRRSSSERASSMPCRLQQHSMGHREVFVTHLFGWMEITSWFEGHVTSQCASGYAFLCKKVMLLMWTWTSLWGKGYDKVCISVFLPSNYLMLLMWRTASLCGSGYVKVCIMVYLPFEFVNVLNGTCFLSTHFPCPSHSRSTSTYSSPPLHTLA